MLLNAKSIAYPDPEGGTGASGVNVVMMLRRLGIEDAVKAKTTLTRGGGRAMAMAASGEAEIGMTYYIGMYGNDKIDIVGTLPAQSRSANAVDRVHLIEEQESGGSQRTAGVSHVARRKRDVQEISVRTGVLEPVQVQVTSWLTSPHAQVVNTEDLRAACSPHDRLSKKTCASPPAEPDSPRLETKHVVRSASAV
jgi:ABC-type molybdate transport system substrate-binding protein